MSPDVCRAIRVVGICAVLAGGFTATWGLILMGVMLILRDMIEYRAKQLSTTETASSPRNPSKTSEAPRVAGDWGNES